MTGGTTGQARAGNVSWELIWKKNSTPARPLETSLNMFVKLMQNITVR